MRLIDADAFIDFMKSVITRQRYDNLTISRTLTVEDVLEAVISELDGTSLDGYENAPTIEPERKMGKWVHGREIGRDKIGDCIIAIIYDGWKCSSCGCLVEESREPLYKFCPQCGADMREE